MTQKIDAFQKMVAALLKKQGVESNNTLSDLMKSMEEGRLGEFMSNVLVDEATKLKAQEMISEKGEWGVEQTATRILDFAKAFSGGDPSKINLLRNAVEMGFKAAEKVWGGKLPEISYKTYDRIMEGFKEWENPVEETAEA